MFVNFSKSLDKEYMFLYDDNRKRKDVRKMSRRRKDHGKKNQKKSC